MHPTKSLKLVLLAPMKFVKEHFTVATKRPVISSSPICQAQWDRHGKCAVAAGLFADQESYFSEALTQGIRYNAFQVRAI